MKSIFMFLFSISLLINPGQTATTKPVNDKQSGDVEITDVRWKLIEINGKAVKTDDPKGYFLELKPDNSFKAYAGCNNMTGHFEYRDSRIHFMRVMGTMKSCPNIQTEEDLRVVLGTVDNFIKTEKGLQFRRGEVLLAKFSAIPK